MNAAAEAHEKARIEQALQEEGADSRSEYLGYLVYGGLDGIITTFAIVKVIQQNASSAKNPHRSANRWRPKPDR